MNKKQYIISNYVQCGEMPLFLIFYHDRRGNDGYCAMLCTHKKLRDLLRLKRGFSTPDNYGHVIYQGSGKEPNDVLKDMLKARYDVNFDNLLVNDIRLF